PQIKIIRLAVLRGAARPLLLLPTAEPELQFVGDVAGDLLLDGKYIGHRPVELFAPNLGAIANIHQVGANLHFVTPLHHPAGKHSRNFEIGANLRWVLLFALVAKDGAASHDAQAGILGQGADHTFGNAVAEVVGVRVAIGVDERQH